MAEGIDRDILSKVDDTRFGECHFLNISRATPTNLRVRVILLLDAGDISSVPAVLIALINPRRMRRRVTVVVLCVCLSVCLLTL